MDKSYIDHLLNHKFFDILQKISIDMFNNSEQKLIIEFAKTQDNAYGYPQSNYNWFQDHMTDDIIEIIIGYDYLRKNQKLKFEDHIKNLMTHIHDAWAYARLIKFTKTGLTPYQEHGKMIVNLSNIGKAKIKKSRLAQFIDFELLSQKEKYKDFIPANTLLGLYLNQSQRKILESLYTKIMSL